MSEGYEQVLQKASDGWADKTAPQAAKPVRLMLAEAFRAGATTGGIAANQAPFSALKATTTRRGSHMTTEEQVRENMAANTQYFAENPYRLHKVTIEGEQWSTVRSAANPAFQWVVVGFPSTETSAQWWRSGIRRSPGGWGLLYWCINRGAAEHLAADQVAEGTVSEARVIPVESTEVRSLVP